MPINRVDFNSSISLFTIPIIIPSAYSIGAFISVASAEWVEIVVAEHITSTPNTIRLSE